MTCNFKVMSPSQNKSNRLLKTYHLVTIPDFSTATNSAAILCNSSNLAMPAYAGGVFNISA